jgi:hypothetical protein
MQRPFGCTRELDRQFRAEWAGSCDLPIWVMLSCHWTCQTEAGAAGLVGCRRLHDNRTVDLPPRLRIGCGGKERRIRRHGQLGFHDAADRVDIARLLERSVPLDRDEAGLYLCTVRCRGADDGHLRSLLLAAAASSGLSARALHSEDVDPAGRAEIRATLAGQGPQDLALECVVSRLRREPGVKAVSWELVGKVHQCPGEQCDRQQPARTRVRPVGRSHRLNLTARKASAAVFRSGTDPLGVSVAFAGIDRRAPKEGAAASSR